MTVRPTVSCVLIFLDGEAFIDEAIASVAAQQDPSWELVLVDDGSTDASAHIAQRWADRDPERIRYAAHPGHANRGMSASRNLGISLARGDLIGFLDCDDVWLSTTVGHVRRLALAHPHASALITCCWRWSSWDPSAGPQPGDRMMDRPAPFPLRTTVEPPALLTAIFRPDGSTRVPAMCSIVVRRDALLAVGGMAAAFGGLYEDQVLYTKVAAGMATVIDDRPLALYRQHPSSESARAAAAGEWTSAPSAAWERFDAWQYEYVVAQLDADSPAVAELVVHARERRLWPMRLSRASASAGVRQRVIRAASSASHRARRVVRRVVARLPAADAPTIIEVWSAQHLGAMGAARRGRVRVIVDVDGEPDGRTAWSEMVSAAAVPVADEVVTGPLNAGAETARFDHVIVAFTVATAEQIALLFGRAGEMVSEGGTVSALLAGRSLDASAPTAALVRRAAALALPHHDVLVEVFGNATTAGLVRHGRPAGDSPGVLLDRHDPLVPVVLAVSALPRLA